MAGIKHTWTLSVKNDAGANVVADTEIVTADAEQNFSAVATAGLTKEIDLDITVANIVSFFIESTVAVTLKTNSTGSPAQTIALAAKKAFHWNNLDAINVNPLTTNITKLFFVNAGAADATIVGGFLLNQ